MAFGIVYGEQQIMLFPIPISMKAKYFVGGLVFIEIISALSAANPSHHGEAVAYVAHLGGLLFGFLYVKMVSRRGASCSAFRKAPFGIRKWLLPLEKRRRAARKFEGRHAQASPEP